MFRLLVLSVIVCTVLVPVSSTCTGPTDPTNLFNTIGSGLPPGTSGDFLDYIRQNVPVWNLLMDPTQQLTVLVFTDQAWSQSGLSPDDPRPGYISTVMSYHVINGTINTATLSSQTFVETLATNNQYVTLGGKGQYLGINKEGNSTISLSYGADSFSNFQGLAYIDPQHSNIAACNGIIHAINQVLLPPNLLSDSLTKTLNSTSFIYASLKSIPPTYLDNLDATSQYTVFAPTDVAFAEVYGDKIHSISSTKWATILSAHVVPNVLFSVNMTVGQEIVTLGGTKLKVTQNGPQGLFINNIRVSEPDVITQNGVLHLIDSVFQSSTSVSQY